MRKQLMTTTALVAAGMMAAAVPALAKGQKVKLGLKGYMEQVVGVTTGRPSGADIGAAIGRSSVDVDSESEIHFKGSGKLDNGITVIADVQLEVTGSPGNIIDEQYVIMRGNFGQLILGSEDNAGHLMTIGYSGSWATGVGQNLTFSPSNWIEIASGISAAARFDGTLNDVRLRSHDNDSNKISYFTPRMEGFQLGASYIPTFQQATQAGTGGGPVAGKSTYHEGWSLGANFDRKIDQVRVGIAAGYLTANSPGTNSTQTAAAWANNADMKAYSVAGRIDFGAFRVAAAFKRNDDTRASGTSTTRSTDGDILDVGARYNLGGGSAVSLGYRTGDMEGERAAAGDEEDDAFMAGYRRALGPGVFWKATLMWADTQDDGATGVDNSGWAVTSSIFMAF